MASSEDTPRPRRPRRSPARSLEVRENQLIGMAVDEAERQIRAGTASSQIITHFLKLGTVREQLEREKIRRENRLLDAKVESLNAADRMEELAKEAVRAMRGYQGQNDDDDQMLQRAEESGQFLRPF